MKTRKTRKLLCVLLSLTMLLSMTAFATGTNAETEHYSIDVDAPGVWPAYIDAPSNAFLYSANMRIDIQASDVDAYANALLANPNYGASVPYTAQWYSSLSVVEVLARLIFAENTYPNRQIERKAIAWTIANRFSYAGGRYPSSFYGIATQAGEYETITGSADNTRGAREPKGKNQYSVGWSEATWYAALLCLTDNTSYIAQLMPKPSGITNQRKFISLTWYNTIRQNGTLSNYFRNNPSGSGIQRKVNGAWYLLSLVTILADDGEFETSVCGYSNLSTLNSAVSLIYGSNHPDTAVSQHNLYYNMVTGE